MFWDQEPRQGEHLEWEYVIFRAQLMCVIDMHLKLGLGSLCILMRSIGCFAGQSRMAEHVLQNTGSALDLVSVIHVIIYGGSSAIWENYKRPISPYISKGMTSICKSRVRFIANSSTPCQQSLITEIMSLIAIAIITDLQRFDLYALRKWNWINKICTYNSFQFFILQSSTISLPGVRTYVL